MEEPNSAIFTHAKMEYTNQLIETLTPQFFDGIKSIYDESKTVYKSNPNKGVLLYFRLFLEKVPGWSNEIVEVETERIIMMSKCDWLDDLITAVFISHTKILTSIGTNPNSNIDLIIPKTINFIHKCYINIAREIWKNPYLYEDNVLGSDYQKNMRTVELIIKESIENTIRKLLPIKEILKQHLESYENNSNENKKMNSNELRQMLLTELKNIKLNENKDELEEINETDDQNKVSEKDNLSESNDNLMDDEEEIINNDDENINENNTLDITTGDNDDGYVSPDEDTIKKNCENLSINDIPDVTEEKYDNIEIKVKDDNEGIDKESILKNYMESIDDDNIDEIKLSIEEDKEIKPVVNNLDELVNDKELTQSSLKEEEKQPSVKEEDNQQPVKEEDNQLSVKEEKQVAQEEIQLIEPVDVNEGNKEENKTQENKKEEFKDDPLFKNTSGPSSPLESPKENVVEEDNSLKLKIIKKDEISEPVENEIISVTKDISDTETVDDFFNHVSEIMENKGVKVDKDTDKYTLFDDIEEEDN